VQITTYDYINNMLDELPPDMDGEPPLLRPITCSQ